MDVLIGAEEVTKIYNRRRPDERTALSEVSLAVGRGEVLALRGPSGSGKSTLLSLIGCMSRPTAGRILVHGQDVAKLPETFLTALRRRTFGFIFQQFHLVRELTALENVLLPLYPLNLPPAAMRKRGRTLLERLELADRSGARVHQLSGGEQQRVAVARALVNDPEVIIADEPTAHLDRRLTGELMEILTEVRREGRTIVMATHDPQLYEHPLVSRVADLRDGRLPGG